MVGLGFLRNFLFVKSPKGGGKGAVLLLWTKSARQFLTDHLILNLLETLKQQATGAIFILWWSCFGLNAECWRLPMLYVGWDWMAWVDIIIGHRSSKSTLGANKINSFHFLKLILNQHCLWVDILRWSSDNAWLIKNRKGESKSD